MTSIQSLSPRFGQFKVVNKDGTQASKAWQTGLEALSHSLDPDTKEFFDNLDQEGIDVLFYQDAPPHGTFPGLCKIKVVDRDHPNKAIIEKQLMVDPDVPPFLLVNILDQVTDITSSAIIALIEQIKQAQQKKNG